MALSHRGQRNNPRFTRPIKRKKNLLGNSFPKVIIFQPKPISKHVVAKRTEGDEENEEPNESSAQYVFVPHSSVLNDTYVRKDTMFLEVKVTQKVNFESISS